MSVILRPSSSVRRTCSAMYYFVLICCNVMRCGGNLPYVAAPGCCRAGLSAPGTAAAPGRPRAGPVRVAWPVPAGGPSVPGRVDESSEFAASELKFPSVFFFNVSTLFIVTSACTKERNAKSFHYAYFTVRLKCLSHRTSITN